jgi:hypothetical protein
MSNSVEKKVFHAHFSQCRVFFAALFGIFRTILLFWKEMPAFQQLNGCPFLSFPNKGFTPDGILWST